MSEIKIVGPFSQLLTLDNLPLKGTLKDAQLQVIEQGGLLIENGKVLKISTFGQLIKEFPKAGIEELLSDAVVLPGFIDCHTHTCFAGSRAMDFAERNSGTSYLEIAEKGGGIWSTVTQTRNAHESELTQLTENRVNQFLKNGITTIEIKSGYGLSLEHEMRMLKTINNLKTKATVVSTCLAAHLKPKDFDGSNSSYLDYLSDKLFPEISNLTKRVDIFIEKSAFGVAESKVYLKKAKAMGFDITVHADQFTSGSSKVAVEFGAASADHLEVISDESIALLAASETVAVALPGASIGLGEPFTPARKLLDAGACLAIGSDFNPGSAPLGDLLAQAAILATFQKLSTAEIFAALTFRAAKALKLPNTGKLKESYAADFQAYPTKDYREILYHQGRMKPFAVWKNGQKI